MIGYIRRIFMTMLWLAVAVFLLLALISYTPNDPSWSHVSSDTINGSEISNLAGRAGAWLADILYMFLGVAAWILVIIAAYEAWVVWRNNSQLIGLFRAIGYLFMLIGTSALATFVLPVRWFGHGVIGQMVGMGLSSWMTSVGASIFLGLLVLLTATFSFDIHWFSWLKRKQLKRSQASNDSDDIEEPSSLTPTEMPINVSDTTVPLSPQIPLPLEMPVAEDEPSGTAISLNPPQEKIKTGNALARFLRQIRADRATSEPDSLNQPEIEAVSVVKESVIAKEMQTAKLDEALYKEAITKTPDSEAETTNAGNILSVSPIMPTATPSNPNAFMPADEIQFLVD